jgi:hypothetical protein
LAARLDRTEVPSIDDALRELQLEPVHQPFRAIFAKGLVRAVLDGAATGPQLDDLERRYAAFLTALAKATGITGDPLALAAATRTRTERVFFADSDRPTDGKDRAALLVWLGLANRRARGGADVAATRAGTTNCIPNSPGCDAGFDEAELGSGGPVRCLALPRPSVVRGRARTAEPRSEIGWPAASSSSHRPEPGKASNTSAATMPMLRWAVRLDAIEAGDTVVDRPRPLAGGGLKTRRRGLRFRFSAAPDRRYRWTGYARPRAAPPSRRSAPRAPGANGAGGAASASLSRRISGQ